MVVQNVTTGRQKRTLESRPRHAGLDARRFNRLTMKCRGVFPDDNRPGIGNAIIRRYTYNAGNGPSIMPLVATVMQSLPADFD
jgi:hypothetical protein